MSLIDRVLAEPEFQAMPPVLVDVGAAGGVHRAWRAIARQSIGVGFEPDAREGAPLAAAQRAFRRWIFCPAIAVPEPPPGGQADLYLTRSPQCSSTLRPRADALAAWAFADQFEVVETRRAAAMTLESALRGAGLAYIDWLKCDTQGTDLRLFQSLPEAWRARLLAVDFEPGLIDAYAGEDHAAAVLTAMGRGSFWLAGMEVGRTPRGRGSPWYRRLAPSAPGWVNLSYLRDPIVADGNPDRRTRLLAWVFATLSGQHGQAAMIAEAAVAAEGGELCAAMAAHSRSAVRWSMWTAFPAWAWRRFGPGR